MDSGENKRQRFMVVVFLIVISGIMLYYTLTVPGCAAMSDRSVEERTVVAKDDAIAPNTDAEQTGLFNISWTEVAAAGGAGGVGMMSLLLWMDRNSKRRAEYDLKMLELMREKLNGK